MTDAVVAHIVMDVAWRNYRSGKISHEAFIDICNEFNEVYKK